MNSVEMAKAIRERARAQHDIQVNPLTMGELADNAELLIVLARVVEGRPIGRAFGSPGDWGYNHPIGRALAATEEEARK